MAHTSGNPAWVDYPSTTTPISAVSLENIEGAADAAAAGLSALKAAVFGGSNRTRPPAAYCYYSSDSASLAAGTNFMMTSGWTKEYDPDGIINLGTGSANAPLEFTAPVGGRYLLEFHAVSSATSGVLYTRFLYNPTNANSIDSRVANNSLVSNAAGGTPEATHSHLATVRALSAGDRLSGVIYSTVGFVFKAGWFGLTAQTRMGIRYLGP